MPEELIITIAAGGRMQIEASGFAGATCHDATAPFVAAAGGEVASDTPTDDLYAQESHDAYARS